MLVFIVILLHCIVPLTLLQLEVPDGYFVVKLRSQSDHLRLPGRHSSLWPKATTFLRSQRRYSPPEATTVCREQRAQHLKSHSG